MPHPDLLSAIAALVPLAPAAAADTVLRRAIADLGAAIGGFNAPVQIALPAPAPVALKPRAKAAGTMIGGREPAVALSDAAMRWLSETPLSQAAEVAGCSTAGVSKWKNSGRATQPYAGRVEAAAAGLAAPDTCTLDPDLIELVWAKSRTEGLSSEADLAVATKTESEVIRAALSGEQIDRKTADRLEAWALA